jgi:hypothetical protein
MENNENNIKNNESILNNFENNLKKNDEIIRIEKEIVNYKERYIKNSEIIEKNRNYMDIEVSNEINIENSKNNKNNKFINQYNENENKEEYENFDKNNTIENINIYENIDTKKIDIIGNFDNINNDNKKQESWILKTRNKIKIFFKKNKNEIYSSKQKNNGLNESSIIKSIEEIKKNSQDKSKTDRVCDIFINSYSHYEDETQISIDNTHQSIKNDNKNKNNENEEQKNNCINNHKIDENSKSFEKNEEQNNNFINNKTIVENNKSIENNEGQKNNFTNNNKKNISNNTKENNVNDSRISSSKENENEHHYDEDDSAVSREKINKKKEKKNNNKKEEFPEIKIKNFNLPISILITFIYLIFGHFFIPINIYLLESNKEKSTLILSYIILIIIPFFFIQIIFNLVLLIFYIKLTGYKLFLTQFYYNIKMEIMKKRSLYKINLITYNVYHILVALFLGTFWKIVKILIKLYGKKNLFISIFGIIFGMIILPLHIIINPFLLFYAFKKQNNNNKEKKKLKTYIYNI